MTQKWQDFRHCVIDVWDALNLPAPTRLQLDTARYMQMGPARRQIQGFRGMAKTYLVCTYAMWRHWKRVQEIGSSDICVLIVSAGKDFADLISSFCFTLMSVVPDFEVLAPTEGQHSSQVKFDVGPKAPSKDPSVKSVGIMGQITGARADVIIADDIETPNTAGTVGQRVKLASRVAEFADIVKPGGEVIVNGTPQTEDTIYWKLLDRGYDMRVWPARYPNTTQQTRLGGRLAPTLVKDLERDPELVGAPTDPERFGHDELLRREAEEGRSRFAQQFQLDPHGMDADSRPLRINDLMVMDLDPELGPDKVVWAGSREYELPLAVFGLSGDAYHRPMFVGDLRPYTGSVMAIDPSGRGKDETAYAVCKILNGTLFVTDFGGFLGGFEDPTLQALARVAATHDVNAILIEQNYGGGMFARLFTPHLRNVVAGEKRGHTCEIIEEHVTGQKERRICDALEPLLNQHRVVVDSRALQRDAGPRDGLGEERAIHYRFAYQLSRITRERGSLAKDDRVECVARACGYWAEHMARTADEALAEQRRADFEKLLSDLDGGPPEANWLSGFVPRGMRS